MAGLRYALGAVLVLVGCSTPPPPEPKDVPLRGSIELTEAPCAGLCPDYKMIVRADDTYTLVGGPTTFTPGETSGSLPVNSFRRAVEALRVRGFTELEREYLSGRGDLCPDYISGGGLIDIARRDGERRTFVTYDPGCLDFDDKDKLDNLVADLRRIFRVDPLIRVGEPPEDEPATE